MKSLKLFYVITIALVIFFSSNVSIAKSPVKQEIWFGTLKDGTKITKLDLVKILAAHKEWVDSEGKEGKRADLKKANLQEVILREAILRDGDLREANLQEADLQEANLHGADLREANLRMANLGGADLQKADMEEAKFEKANLSRARLQKANLSNAILRKANLSLAFLQEANLWGADLQEASLEQAYLNKVNLRKANLKKANLRKAILPGGDLRGADLQGANLSQADLEGAFLLRANLKRAILGSANLKMARLALANLQEANLAGAILQKADLWRADLQEANLEEADLQEANLEEANLQEVIITGANLNNCYLFKVSKPPFKYYEPRAVNTPYLPSIVDAEWLKDLTYDSRVNGLLDLREGFKKLGYREQERQITYAIKHSQTLKLLDKSINGSSIPDLLKGSIDLIFFELTCDWGMSPSRPLVILFLLIIPFSFVYMLAMIKTHINKKAGIKDDNGIWKVWVVDRANTNIGNDQNQLLSVSKWYHIVGHGLYFSLLSAFHLGYRDINVGGLITKLQPYEYRLAASGWVRTISGIQSIISFILLALLILSYFGRPFESY